MIFGSPRNGIIPSLAPKPGSPTLSSLLATDLVACCDFHGTQGAHGCIGNGGMHRYMDDFTKYMGSFSHDMIYIYIYIGYIDIDIQI